MRLTAERDTDALLEMILTKAREITRSDGGSLYLVEELEDGERRLRFKLAQNDSVAVPFTEFTLPISGDSIAGHVAATGEILHLDDARTLPPARRFSSTATSTPTWATCTKSMLVVPMKTPSGQVIGVIQLINMKRRAGQPFTSADAIDAETLPYPERFRRPGRVARVPGRRRPREQPALSQHRGAVRRASSRPRSPPSSLAIRPRRGTPSGWPT